MFNIDDLTVHKLLQLSVEHGNIPKYKPLADHVLKFLRADLKDVILFIIDEVSMISNLTLINFFNKSNLRVPSTIENMKRR